MEWFKKLFFLFDFIENIKDLWEVIRDKESNVWIKIVCALVTIIALFISVKIWL